MSKNIAGIGIALAALLLIGGLVIMNNKDTKTNSSQNTAASSQPAQHEDMAQAQEQPAQDNKPQAVNQVEVKNFDFTQKKITIKKGTTVTWTNKDNAKHDITPDTESPDFTAGPLFGKGETYSFTFNKAGTYSYHCSPHPFMKASVEVTE